MKVRSFSEFVADSGGLGLPSGDETGAVAEVVVTYHDPCHLGRRYQNVVDHPRQLLRSIPGLTLRELTESDSCCGAAGTYGVLHPETSAAIIDRKMGFVSATGASVVVTECPSCMMQLSYGARRAGLDVEVLNVSQMCERVAGTRFTSPAKSI